MSGDMRSTCDFSRKEEETIMTTRRTILIGAAASVVAPAILTSRSEAGGALELNKPGVLTAAAEGTFPPYSFLNEEGEYDGIGRKAMAEIASRLDLEYNPVITRWESLLVGVLANQFDIAASAMGINAERQKQVYFCDAWVESGSRLFVRDDAPYEKSADLKGKKVGALVASIFIPVAENIVGPDGGVPLFQADVEGMQDVVNRNIEGVILDSISAAYIITKSKLPLRGMPNIEQSYQLGWPVSKDKPNLVRAVNKRHREIVEDGTFANICQPLIGFDPTPKSPIRSLL